jgi:flagellar biogenesis protein FliO
MELNAILTSVVSLALICGLIIAGLALVKKYNLANLNGILSQKTISIEEIQYLDQSRKIVLVSHKDKKYLLLLGNKELLIDEYKS